MQEPFCLDISRLAESNLRDTRLFAGRLFFVEMAVNSNYRGMIEGERWAVIHDGTYAVSDQGRIMRTARGGNATPGNLRIVSQGKDGYMGVIVIHHNKRMRIKIHVAVAREFIGVRPAGHEINHIDGNKRNNKVENLEYVTPKENREHAVRIGLVSVKITDEQVQQIKRSLERGLLQREVAAIHNCDRSYVSLIARGKRRSQTSIT